MMNTFEPPSSLSVRYGKDPFSDHSSRLQINYLKNLHTGARKDEIRAQYRIEF